METCPTCPFAWDAVTSAEITPRVSAAARGFATLLRAHPDDAPHRLAPDTWSMIEYGCHVRDVFFNLRDRIILGAAEDHPRPHPMHVDARVALGLYRNDTAPILADEIEMAGAVFTRTFDALPDEFDERPIFYPWPAPATRNLRWVAAQALHECEHHLADAESQVLAAP